MKTLIEFSLSDGGAAFVEIEETELLSRKRVAREGDGEVSLRAERTFSDAISCITPVANSLLERLKAINAPETVSLEFGFTFNAKAGVIFTSVESTANFKVAITWKNK